LTRFLADGRICLTNNYAERNLRGVALGRKSWLFAGSDRGGERAAAMYTLIATALCRGYAARGITRFIPTAKLCRTVLGGSRRLTQLRPTERTSPQFHSA